MNGFELYDLMKSLGMISGNWRHMIALLQSELKAIDENKQEPCLKLLILYLSLIDSGNVYMSLDKEILVKKIEAETEALKAKYEEYEDESKASYADIVRGELLGAIEALSDLHCIFDSIHMVHDKQLFVIDNDNPNNEFRLFTRKHFNAKAEIISSIDRLFPKDKNTSNEVVDYSADFKIELSGGQKEVISKGIKNNLLVTGGPGTGKTTSVLFLLIKLLEDKPDFDIYLTAPSGKAAARMKESIIDNLKNVSIEYKEAHQNILKKVNDLEEYTIHRLLGFDRATNGFEHNKNNQFQKNSIFVVDEASMIDIDIFASLLSAIPEEARLFIMGDKNQLPSVECGAVYGELLGFVNDSHKVELKKSHRFPIGSSIYNLAEAINNSNSELPVTIDSWKELNNLEIFEPTYEKGDIKNMIYYYDGVKDFKSGILDDKVCKWYDHFHKSLIDQSKGIASKDDGEYDSDRFDSLLETAERARILCADNESVRGVNHINNVILKKRFNGQRRYFNYYIGELLMITRNNKSLDLYNGDSGVAVSFEGDDTIYIMFKKSSKILKLDDGKKENRIFKIGNYMFYPLSLISSDEITPAFAISIHKSQGSDYNNIMVILPKRNDHPLLNRQIVYTAITRTKGDTYLISNQENIEAAQENVIIRDTGIFK